MKKKFIFAALSIFSLFFVFESELIASASTGCQNCTEEVLCDDCLENETLKTEVENISPNAIGGPIVEDDNNEGFVIVSIEEDNDTY